MDQHLETIGAFIDGERVDTEALRAALATDEGRAYLVEVAAMRELVAMPAAATFPPEGRSSGGRNSAGAWSPKLLAAAAGLVLIVGAGGFALGTLSNPAPTVSTSSRAPEPTKVLKLEPGVNWKDNESTKGGN